MQSQNKYIGDDKMQKMLDVLDDLDDVQNVYHNGEISDEVAAQL